MNNYQIEKLFKDAKPIKEPEIKEPIRRSCNNCMDSIVCYGLKEPNNPKKGENCPDWQLDFMEYQNMLESEQGESEKK